MMGMDVNESKVRRTGSLGVERIACIAVLTGVFAGTFPPAARGDIYWFQDEQGVVHMSNVPVDQRFRFKERESRGEEVKILSGRRGRTYEKLIDRVARAEGLDTDLLRAVVQAESNFDPNAISKKPVRPGSTIRSASLVPKWKFAPMVRRGSSGPKTSNPPVPSGIENSS